MKQIIPKQTSALTAGLSILAALGVVILFGTAAFTAEAAGSGTTLTFTDSAVTASGESGGYEISGTDLTITEAGTYTLTGSCADGSVTVKKGTTGVTLVLDGLTLTSTDSAAVSCNKETEVTLKVTGSNTLTNAEDIANEESADFDGAVIKAKSGASLTLTGDGTLTVNGDCKNGIKGAALSTITVDSGTLVINAENNGIAGDNAVVISGGSLTVTAGNDGIKAEPDEDDTDSAGNVTVTGGTLSIAAEDDGISAARVLTIGTEGAATGPDITVTKCTEGLEGAAVNLFSGKAVITSTDDGINAANSDLTDYAYAITVTGGSWYVNAGGDAMDSNGDITVTGGIAELFGSPNNGNNALDYEGKCTVSGGTLFTVDCAGMNQVPSSGTYVIFGQTNSMGFGGRMPQMGQDGQRPELPEGVTPPDGMMPPDFTGGQNGQPPALPDGMTPPDFSGDGQNGERPTPPDGMTPPDVNGENANGQGRGQGGGHNGQTVDTSAISIRSGSRLEVKDSSGQTLYSATGTKTANCVMLSSQDLKAGETYTLYVDGEAVATAEAREGTGQGGFTPGGGFPSGQQGRSDGQQSQQNGQQGQQSGQQGQPRQDGETRTDTGYSDVADDAWYKDAVSYVTEKNMMNGTGGSRFAPDGETTRAMVVTILYRLEGSPETGKSSYSDVAGDAWYADAVAWAEENGIVNGTGDGKFSPDRPVTRQQLAAILYRYAIYKDLDVSQAGDLSGFTDRGNVQSYAREAMEWTCGAKLIQGVSTDRLQPDGGATRAQVATILQRLCENVMK